MPRLRRLTTIAFPRGIRLPSDFKNVRLFADCASITWHLQRFMRAEPVHPRSLLITELLSCFQHFGGIHYFHEAFAFGGRAPTHVLSRACELTEVEPWLIPAALRGLQRAGVPLSRVLLQRSRTTIQQAAQRLFLDTLRAHILCASHPTSRHRAATPRELMPAIVAMQRLITFSASDWAIVLAAGGHDAIALLDAMHPLPVVSNLIADELTPSIAMVRPADGQRHGAFCVWFSATCPSQRDTALVTRIAAHASLVRLCAWIRVATQSRACDWMVHSLLPAALAALRALRPRAWFPALFNFFPLLGRHVWRPAVGAALMPFMPCRERLINSILPPRFMAFVWQAYCLTPDFDVSDMDFHRRVLSRAACMLTPQAHNYVVQAAVVTCPELQREEAWEVSTELGRGAPLEPDVRRNIRGAAPQHGAAQEVP